MEFVNHGDDRYTLELSRRNLEILLAKLDDPLSARTITKLGADFKSRVTVKAVENEEHYSDRQPGEMYMPSTGETL